MKGERQQNEYALLCEPTLNQNVIHTHMCMKVKVKSFSRVQLLATSWTVAHQASLSMGLSRQEYRSGVPLPSPQVSIAYVLCQSTQ